MQPEKLAMLNKLLKLFNKKQAVMFEPTTAGWLLPVRSEQPVHTSNAFDWADQQPEDQLGLAMYLAQLITEEKAQWVEQGILILWHSLYALLQDEEHQSLLESLQLPSIDPNLQPVINNNSRYTLADAEFSPKISGWQRDAILLKNTNLVGAVLRVAEHERVLLPAAAWKLSNELDQFQQRPDTEKNQHQQELAWGRLRHLADKANAAYASRYLESTFIITPETLQLGLMRSEALGETIIRVNPGFTGAPAAWLERFDQLSQVQNAYDFSTDTGMCRVILSAPVKQVLQVIKRDMPGRRVIGKKAQAFIRNPYAFLGESAFQVLDETEFEAEKEQLGSLEQEWRIRPQVQQGFVVQVFLQIEVDNGSESLPFHVSGNLQTFLEKLEQALTTEEISLAWPGYHLMLDGGTHSELAQGLRILTQWKADEKQIIHYEDIFNWDNYSDRIIGIGEMGAVNIPILIKSESNESFVPDLVEGIMIQTPDMEKPVIVPATKDYAERLERSIQEAQRQAEPQVKMPDYHFSIPTAQAIKILDIVQDHLAVAAKEPIDEALPPKEKGAAKPTLIPLLNFNSNDYIKQRQQWLNTPEDYLLTLPINLRGHIKLKKHQKEGVRRMQYLASVGEGCEGILLADDMGLGKTLQILCLLARHYELHPTANPALIIAPVTLLDNWEQEVDKFFDQTFPPVLRLHGKALQARRQPPNLIDEQLKTANITKHLQNDWLGDAKLVISTYETIRDYEFSLARQDFEFIICDEAQKIKNPKATVTLAVKKQKGRFKIACTGTPVENHLVDLWCLFDWIQPGLLGTVRDFHSAYRRPIETRTEEEKQALNQLVELIDSQILRRTKQDISDELRTKHELTQKLKISAYQFQLYQKSWLELGKVQQNESDARRRVKVSWSLLHRIKAICAEPYCLPGQVFRAEKPENFNQHLQDSPKADWLLRQLEDIKARNEKAIIFTELRQVQIAIGYFLKKKFGFSPIVVNGDSKHRQALIDRFQQQRGFNAIVLSPLAAGAGLNIVEANHVIHFTRTWNPAKEAQATDRAYRIGQTKDVYVYRPIITAQHIPEFGGMTFEEKLDKLMLSKVTLADNILDMLNGTGPDVGVGAFIENEANTNGGKTPALLSATDLDALDGFSFELLCGLLLEHQGFETKLTKKTGDGGIDLVATSRVEKKGLLVQCKSSSQKNKRLGIEAIQQVVGGAASYEKSYKNVRFGKVAATNQYFNERAQALAKDSNVLLWDKDHLLQLCMQHLINRRVIDDYIEQHTKQP